MSTDGPFTARPSFLRILSRKNALAGLMFIGIAAFGLWASRNYPVGTALRMSTGYVPRLLCWILMGLGAIVLVQGLREADPPEPAAEAAADAAPDDGALSTLLPLVVVTLSLAAFALALQTLGLLLTVPLMVAVASFATRELKAWETLAAGVALCALSWAIFVFGLGLPIPVWPDW